MSERYAFTDWDWLGAETVPQAAGFSVTSCTCDSGLKFADVRYPADPQSLDLSHLGGALDPTAFALTGAALQALADANSFELPAGRVLFGLRGCSPVNAPDGLFAPSVALREEVPDHAALRCTIGVWDRTNGTLVAFRASTVPNRVMVWAQACGCAAANLLLTGRHRYVVGTHHSYMLGAFRPAEPKAFARSKTDLVIDTADPIFGESVPDNIHCSYLRSEESAADPAVRFSSAGCQTVYGTWDMATRTHKDPPGEKGWATFRACAGLATPSYAAGVTNDPQDGTEFAYLLLTGREARIAATGGSIGKRLRFGSRGPAVNALQTAIGAPVTGTLDAKTVDILTGKQRKARQSADGIVRPGDYAGVI